MGTVSAKSDTVRPLDPAEGRLGRLARAGRGERSLEVALAREMRVSKASAKA